MPRNIREPSKSGIYHIVLRSVSSQDCFHEDEDFTKYLEVLESCSAAGNIRIHAYCLMKNHIHLLLQAAGDSGNGPPSKAVQQIVIRYAKYHNFKYDRSGPLFLGRYKSEPVDTNEYYHAVLRHIHRNPVKAGIVKSPEKYRWSSYGDYTGKKGFVYTDLGTKLLAGRFEAYMNEDGGTKCLDINDAARRMTDPELSAKIEEMFQMPATDVGLLETEERNAALRQIVELGGVTYRQIFNVTGVSPSIISRAVNKVDRKNRGKSN